MIEAGVETIILELRTKVNDLTLLIKGFGILFFIWIIYTTIILIIERKKLKRLKNLENKINEINNKLKNLKK